MGYKIFPCIDIHGGQARPCWTRQLLHTLLPLSLSEDPLSASWKCSLDVVGLSTMWNRRLLRYAKISLSATSYSMALSALADGHEV